MDIHGDQISYIKSLVRERHDVILELETYAKEYEIPIMELDGIETLLQFLRVQQPAKILEIGTAIGYSAIRMLNDLPQTKVISIERDEERAKLALDNVRKASFQSRFHLVEGDALDVSGDVENKGPFDVLFIDAAKGQYERFFTLYEPMVSVGGLIFSDNVLFKGMVSSTATPESRGLRALVKKIRAYNEKLMNDQRFQSVLLPVGDGLMVSKKIEVDNE
ncbi:O-methyltransferase [Salipaludibacillus daqingensis]|uniref:O-methyltransferase n=1 Tax=Salipaludibacillus daqingensis TaxID=3041001 RepID=UPI0024756420|nr:O-methyltransferase [Salipaludibacillus daqingensis]